MPRQGVRAKFKRDQVVEAVKGPEPTTKRFVRLDERDLNDAQLKIQSIYAQKQNRGLLKLSCRINRILSDGGVNISAYPVSVSSLFGWSRGELTIPKDVIGVLNLLLCDIEGRCFSELQKKVQSYGHGIRSLEDLASKINEQMLPDRTKLHGYVLFLWSYGEVHLDARVLTAISCVLTQLEIPSETSQSKMPKRRKSA